MKGSGWPGGLGARTWTSWSAIPPASRWSGRSGPGTAATGTRCGEAEGCLSRTAPDDRHGRNQGQTCRRAVADQDRVRDGHLARNRLQGQRQDRRAWQGRSRSVGSPGRPRPAGVMNTAICSPCVLQDVQICSFGPFRPICTTLVRFLATLSSRSGHSSMLVSCRPSLDPFCCSCCC